jgi:hypothetical protein
MQAGFLRPFFVNGLIGKTNLPILLHVKGSHQGQENTYNKKIDSD